MTVFENADVINTDRDLWEAPKTPERTLPSFAESTPFTTSSIQIVGEAPHEDAPAKPFKSSIQILDDTPSSADGGKIISLDDSSSPADGGKIISFDDNPNETVFISEESQPTTPIPALPSWLEEDSSTEEEGVGSNKREWRKKHEEIEWKRKRLEEEEGNEDEEENMEGRVGARK